jgi:undecaprenyl diphosphate synthase
MTDANDNMADELIVDEDLLDTYSGPVPNHLAVIMDGNGRWARRRDMPRIRGHREGADSVRHIVEACRYLEADVLTLYAFSSENWERPDDEVTGLMTLFDYHVTKQRNRILDNDIRLQVIGDRDDLADELRQRIEQLEAESADNDEMILQLAVSYGGRAEITQAARTIAERIDAGDLDPSDIDEEMFDNFLYTAGQPDPGLVVRTSGEMRLSNFLLWQIAYSELYVTDTLWPDFREPELIEALKAFGRRDRRYGKTAEQLDDHPDNSHAS